MIRSITNWRSSIRWAIFGDIQRNSTYVGEIVDAVVHVLDERIQGVRVGSPEAMVSFARAREYSMGQRSPKAPHYQVVALENEHGMKST